MVLKDMFINIDASLVPAAYAFYISKQTDFTWHEELCIRILTYCNRKYVFYYNILFIFV